MYPVADTWEPTGAATERGRTQYTDGRRLPALNDSDDGRVSAVDVEGGARVCPGSGAETVVLRLAGTWA